MRAEPGWLFPRPLIVMELIEVASRHS